MNQAQINGGKRGAAVTNYKRREAVKQAERRTAEMAVAVKARCPATLHDWIAMLPPSQVEKGKLPRIYCPQHESRRNISEAYYGRLG
jgi:hypothetical protein